MKGTNKEGICEWFSHLKKIVHNYGLQSSKIYNMMGVGGKERVVVPEGDQAASFRSQPGNRDSAMVVECIGSGEKVLPPLVLTKGQIHTVGEHQLDKAQFCTFYAKACEPVMMPSAASKAFSFAS